jgi:hypothetical protein
MKISFLKYIRNNKKIMIVCLNVWRNDSFLKNYENEQHVDFF